MAERTVHTFTGSPVWVYCRVNVPQMNVEIEYLIEVDPVTI
jgi:hypothetical protein